MAKTKNPTICVKLLSILEKIDEIPPSKEREEFKAFISRLAAKGGNKLPRSLEVFEKDAEKILKAFTEITSLRASIKEINLTYVARILSQGFSVNDCMTVIRDRHYRWKDDSVMVNYLRIETLFRPTKFQGYLDQALSQGSPYRRWEKETMKEKQIHEEELKLFVQ